jgi:xylulokinase
VDIGTTSVKAVAVDATGAVVARARLPHPVLVPAPDRLEHDADRAWRRGPLRALRQLGVALDAVAVSAMVPSLTAVDERGRPVAPGLLYGDGRGAGDGGEGAGFLRWLQSEAPDAAGFWPAPAVANHALGGVGVIDSGTAFSLGLGDDARLATTANIGAPIGRVTGSDATLVAGCVDGLCEQLVAGADQPGDVLVVCGTTLIVWVVTEAEHHVPGLWTVPHPSGRWVVGGASNAGGLFQEWARRLLPRRVANTVDPARVPVWVPYVRGERTPLHDPSRRASLHGLDLSHDAAAVERAVHEAAGFVVRHHLDLAGLPADRIVATGGGTRIGGLMAALADCTGLPVHVAAEPEGAAIGAAYLARMGLGAADGFGEASTWARTRIVVDPDPAWVERCADRYRTFRDLAGAP